MKKAYKKPMVMLINYCYDEQIVAASGNCNQAWTNMTDSMPPMARRSCSKCADDLIWLNPVK